MSLEYRVIKPDRSKNVEELRRICKSVSGVMAKGRRPAPLTAAQQLARLLDDVDSDRMPKLIAITYAYNFFTPEAMELFVKNKPLTLFEAWLPRLMASGEFLRVNAILSLCSIVPVELDSSSQLHRYLSATVDALPADTKSLVESLLSKETQKEVSKKRDRPKDRNVKFPENDADLLHIREIEARVSKRRKLAESDALSMMALLPTPTKPWAQAEYIPPPEPEEDDEEFVSELAKEESSRIENVLEIVYSDKSPDNPTNFNKKPLPACLDKCIEVDFGEPFAEESEDKEIGEDSEESGLSDLLSDPNLHSILQHQQPPQQQQQQPQRNSRFEPPSGYPIQPPRPQYVQTGVYGHPQQYRGGAGYTHPQYSHGYPPQGPPQGYPQAYPQGSPHYRGQRPPPHPSQRPPYPPPNGQYQGGHRSHYPY